MPENETDWLDVANLLYGDITQDPQHLQELADKLEQIREAVIEDTVPKITDMVSARHVYGQMLYKINVLEQKKQQFYSKKAGSSYSQQEGRSARNTQSTVQVDNASLLSTISSLTARYKLLKIEVDALENQLIDSAQADAVNQQLQEIFGDPLDELDQTSS